MMDNIVFFDVETKYLAEEVGGWSCIDKMGLAVAVTYSTTAAAFHHYTEEQVDELVAELRGAGLVVGFNVLRFDYAVLQPHTRFPLRSLPTVDLLDHLYRALGFRVSLAAVAQATLNSAKLGDGVQAVHWFRQGEVDRVLAYCQRDVEVTRGVYEYGKRNGYVHYHDRRYGLQRVLVKW